MTRPENTANPPQPGQRDIVHSILDSSPVDLGGDPTVQRPLFEMIMAPQPMPDDLTVTPVTLDGVQAAFIDLTTVPEPVGTLIYLHGGAYALGSYNSAVGLASSLARRAGMRAVAIDYRLAPEHPYPAALDDVVLAYRALLQRGDLKPEQIAIAGDSAGGGLAAAALVAIGRARLPEPAAAVLFSPWADLTLSGSTLEVKAAADHILTVEALEVRASDYAGTTDRGNPLISPIHADLRGLPPVLIQAGSDEILLDDAVRLAARAAADEVPVTLEVTPRVPHIFQVFASLLDEADAALDRAATFLRAHLPS